MSQRAWPIVSRAWGKIIKWRIEAGVSAVLLKVFFSRTAAFAQSRRKLFIFLFSLFLFLLFSSFLGFFLIAFFYIS